MTHTDDSPIKTRINFTNGQTLALGEWTELDWQNEGCKLEMGQGSLADLNPIEEDMSPYLRYMDRFQFSFRYGSEAARHILHHLKLIKDGVIPEDKRNEVPFYNLRKTDITFTNGQTLPVGNWTVEEWMDVGYNEGMQEPKLEPIEEDREDYAFHWLRVYPCYYFGRDQGRIHFIRNKLKEKYE